MGKSINVRVTTADDELEFFIQPSTTGQQMLDQVFNIIGLQEICFFGLQYTDVKNCTTWLKLKKKVIAQEIKKESPLQFTLRSKFFPENVVSELTQDITQRLFFLQIKESILSEEIYCSSDTSVLLASYAAQVKYGSYKRDIHISGFLSSEKLLPEGVYTKYQITKEQLEERVTSLWSKHTNISRQNSMMEYLKIAQDLEMFGVNYFEIKNKSGVDLLIGINALGINIYEPENKLKPIIVYHWNSIQNLSFNGKKFYIKLIDRKAHEFIFYVSHHITNKSIMSLCMDNYELYLRRRKPLTEVHQIKAQMRNKKNEKHDDAENEKIMLELRLKKFEEEARLAHEALEKAKQEAEILQEKKRQTEEEARRVKMLQLAAEEARLRLEQEAEHERMEKLEFERKSSESSAEIQRLIQESEKLKLLLKSKLRDEEQQTKIFSSSPSVVLQTNEKEENNNSILMTQNTYDEYLTTKKKVTDDSIMVRASSVSSVDKLTVGFVSFIYKEIY